MTIEVDYAMKGMEGSVDSIIQICVLTNGDEIIGLSTRTENGYVILYPRFLANSGFSFCKLSNYSNGDIVFMKDSSILYTLDPDLGTCERYEDSVDIHELKESIIQ